MNVLFRTVFPYPRFAVLPKWCGSPSDGKGDEVDDADDSQQLLLLACACACASLLLLVVVVMAAQIANLHHPPLWI